MSRIRLFPPKHAFGSLLQRVFGLRGRRKIYGEKKRGMSCFDFIHRLFSLFLKRADQFKILGWQRLGQQEGDLCSILSPAHSNKLSVHQSIRSVSLEKQSPDQLNNRYFILVIFSGRCAGLAKDLCLNLKRKR